MEDYKNIFGASVFNLITIFLTIIPLLYLSLLGFNTENLRAIVVAVIFFSFLIMPFVFDFWKFTLQSKESYGAAALSFSIGAVLALALNWKTALTGAAGGGMSVFSIPINWLFSELSSNLPIFWNFYANIFGAAVAEEMLFLITLPTVIFISMDFAGRNVETLKNKYLQIAVAAAVAGVLFAVFHIGNIGLIGFIISAIIFRTFLIGMVYGDSKTSIIPYVSILPSFAISFHAFNNMSIFGVIPVIQTFITEPFGIITLIFLGSTFVFGFFYFLKMIGLRKS